MAGRRQEWKRLGVWDSVWSIVLDSPLGRFRRAPDTSYGIMPSDYAASGEQTYGRFHERNPLSGIESYRVDHRRYSFRIVERGFRSPLHSGFGRLRAVGQVII